MDLADRLPATARRRLRVLGWRARRPLAALCAGLAVLLVVERVRPPDPPTRTLTVAARDLAAGATLGDDDVALRPVPLADVPAVPDEGPDPVGRRLAVPVPAGLVLAPGLFVAEDAAPPDGTVVVPVRFADAGVAGVLRPGMRVDVVAAAAHDGAEPERVARAATVLAGPDAADAPDAGGGLLGGDAGPDPPGPVLLAVTPEESVQLGGAAASRVLSAVIVG